MYLSTSKRPRNSDSFSRFETSGDAAVADAESFFSTLKNELMPGRVFESREQARAEIFEYIEVFYNRRRIHQSLNYTTPEQKEASIVTT